jgi:hypothetical protein
VVREVGNVAPPSVERRTSKLATPLESADFQAMLALVPTARKPPLPGEVTSTLAVNVALTD